MKLYAKLSAIIVLSASIPAHAAGLPQLDHTWFSNQVLWLVVTFLALYAVVSCLIAPTVDKLLLARESAIADAVRDAEEAKRAAETTRTHFESAGQSARSTAAEFTARAQAESARDAADAMVKLDAELARKMDQAEARIQDATGKAISGMQAATVSIAKAMVEKLLGETIPAADVEQSVARVAKAK